MYQKNRTCKDNVWCVKFKIKESITYKDTEKQKTKLKII